MTKLIKWVFKKIVNTLTTVKVAKKLLFICLGGCRYTTASSIRSDLESIISVSGSFYNWAEEFSYVTNGPKCFIYWWMRWLMICCGNSRFVKINKSRGLWRWCSTLQLTHKKQSKNQSKIGGKPGAGIRHGIPRRRTEQNGMANICKDCITRLTLITTSWTSRLLIFSSIILLAGWFDWFVWKILNLTKKYFCSSFEINFRTWTGD